MKVEKDETRLKAGTPKGNYQLLSESHVPEVLHTLLFLKLILCDSYLSPPFYS